MSVLIMSNLDSDGNDGFGDRDVDSDEDDESDEEDEEDDDEYFNDFKRNEFNDNYGYLNPDRDGLLNDDDEEHGFIYDDTTPVNGKRRGVLKSSESKNPRRKLASDIKIDKTTNGYYGAQINSLAPGCGFDGDDSIVAGDTSMSMSLSSDRKNSLGKFENATIHFSLKPLHATGKKLELEMSKRIEKLNTIRDKSAAGLNAEQLYDEIHK
jgi:hypothetical protein